MLPVIHPPADDGSVTVELAYPFTPKGAKAELREVTLRRCRAGDFRKVAGLDADAQSFRLVELCGGLLPADVDCLDVADWNALVGVVSGFSRAGQTGA